MRTCFDIETDNLYPKVTTVHCIATKDLDSGEERLFVNSAYRGVRSDGTLGEGLDLLKDSTELYGHNIVGYDLRVLWKLMKWLPDPDTKLVDTYVKALLAFPHLKSLDFARRAEQARRGEEQFPGNLCGAQNLKGWGNRLGIHKGTFGDNRKDWSVYDDRMGEYCLQDIRVNAALVNRLAKEDARVPESLLETEQYLHVVMTQQEEHGYRVDLDRLNDLIHLMQADTAKLEDEIQEIFPPREVVYFTPKRRDRKTKTVVFNPGSRAQIGQALMDKYGWEPKLWGVGGKPTVDEKVLAGLPYPEAAMFREYLMLKKRTGQIADGKKGWLRKVDDAGRLHPRTIIIGTPHGRCAHSNPNVAQIPSPKKKYGKECREAFVPSDGYVQLGCDAQGIQLRALAHYLARLDGGNYVKVVTEGDPHTANQKAAGLSTRDAAKTFIYSFLFGAGDGHIGRQLGAKQGNDKAARILGRSTRARFLRGLPALQGVLDGLTRVWKERGGKNGGYIEGIDGRFVPVPSDHVLLNYLLTSFEVAVMKLAHKLLHTTLSQDLGWTFGKEYAQLAFVHDEYQFEVLPDLAETLGEKAQWAIQEAGVRLGSRCPLDGEYKIGNNWYDCH